MDWTPDKPSTEGWFWLRLAAHDIIVEVYDHADDGLMVDLGSTQKPTAYKMLEDAEWAGPIPHPDQKPTAQQETAP
jgi:hypothetical protein